MRKIFKYILETKTGIQSIDLPSDNIFLSAKVQGNDDIVLYFSVAESESVVMHKYVLVETGKTHDSGEYIDTLMLFNGVYVLHLFDVTLK